MKTSELRDMSPEELQGYYEEQCKELFMLRNEKSETKKLAKPHLLHFTRKNIARALTLIHEKKSKT